MPFQMEDMNVLETVVVATAKGRAHPPHPFVSLKMTNQEHPRAGR